MANEAPISEVKLAQQTVAYVTVAGASASASQTTIPLEADGQQLDGPMIPVPARCYLERIGVSWFADSNPIRAIDQFLAENSAFERIDPPQAFNESKVNGCLTYWPQGWLRRTR